MNNPVVASQRVLLEQYKNQIDALTEQVGKAEQQSEACRQQSANSLSDALQQREAFVALQIEMKAKGGAEQAEQAEQGRRSAEEDAELVRLRGEVAQVQEKEQEITTLKAEQQEQLKTEEAHRRKEAGKFKVLLAASRAKASSLKDALEAKNSAMSETAHTLESENAHLKEQVGLLNSQVLEHEQSLGALEGLSAKYAETESQLMQLKSDIVDANGRVEAMGAEGSRVAGELRQEQLLRRRMHNQLEDIKGKIRVFARCRPLSKTEKGRGDGTAVDFRDPFTCAITQTNNHSTGKEPRAFSFDRVFDDTSTQEEVFEDTNSLVQSAVDGFNVCIFAYGQTGSGKTYTMAGAGGAPGITPRALTRLFEVVEETKARKKGTTVEVTCYMMELYRDTLCDLLLKKKRRNNAPDANANKPVKLIVKRDPRGVVYVQGATVLGAANATELQKHMDYGMGQRHVSSTAMNAESSRSHLVFAVMIKTTESKSGKTVNGKLTLVDLAGCERVGKTGASGDLLKEAQSINKSLTALGDVISALSSGSAHVPYRNSQLTQLMSDSLGGNAKTLMFVNISPADYNADETVNALTYAARVKLIKNSQSKGAETKEVSKLKGMIKDLQEGIEPKSLQIG